MLEIPKQHKEIFETIGNIAESAGQQVFVVGGYVRDYYLQRLNPDEITDIDFVTVGSGIQLAKKIAKERFLKAENEAKEWQKLSKRKQMRVMPPSIYDTLVDVNGVDYLYYSSGKGRLMAREGKGYYVRMKTKSGVVDAKI